ncbi:MAG TPA: hypothetical protein VGJ20_39040 [Xanthobacteraceae bacterium]|jgi:hypothetical protein
MQTGLGRGRQVSFAIINAKAEGIENKLAIGKAFGRRRHLVPAAQCRALADEVSDNDAASRSMLALALELDAQAVAVEARRVTALEIEAVATNGGEKPQYD